MNDPRVSMPIFIAGEIGLTLVSEELWLPTVSIDVSHDPAISDLGRVHFIEGIGDVSTHVIRHGDFVVMGIQVTIPVKATFAVVFSRVIHKSFLLDVAVAGALTLATTTAESVHDEQPLWLTVDIDGDLLRMSIE